MVKSAGKGSSEYVTGNKMIIAIGELRPGKAPTNNPKKVPKNNKTKFIGSKQFANPPINPSNTLTPRSVT